MNEKTIDSNNNLERLKHRASPVAEYFKEVVYGGVDGIITTFAVVSGFSGAALASNTTTQVSFAIVLLFGLANLFADAVSMGLGNFLSVRSEKDHYRILRGREKTLIRQNSDKETEETVALLLNKGFNEENARALANIYKGNEEYWLDFMMANDYELSDPRGDNPVLTGLSTFIAFIIFGAIPILPFLLFGDSTPTDIFYISTAGTLFSLIILGLLKWKVVGTGMVRSVLEMVIVGGVAAVIAFWIGTFFQI